MVCYVCRCVRFLVLVLRYDCMLVGSVLMYCFLVM